MGDQNMDIGLRIEQIRQERGIPVHQMCTNLAIGSDIEYHKIISGQVNPTVFQQILVIISTKMALF